MIGCGENICIYKKAPLPRTPQYSLGVHPFPEEEVEAYLRVTEPAVVKPKGRPPGALNKKRNKKSPTKRKRTRSQAFEESTQRQPSGFEYVEGIRDIITASQAAMAGINTAFTASQVAREEVNTEADASLKEEALLYLH